MSQGNSNSGSPSDTDSSLSVTGNIVGILTLAYAVVVTVVLWALQVRQADTEIDVFTRELKFEIEAMTVASRRLKIHANIKQLTTTDRGVSYRLHMAMQKADELGDHVRNIVDVTKKLQQGSMWRRILAAGQYVAGKEDLAAMLKRTANARNELEQIYDVLIQSIMLEETQKQTEELQRQKHMLSEHTTLLHKIFSALGIDPVEGASDRKEDSRPPSKSNAFDILDAYLRPRTEWDPPATLYSKEGFDDGGCNTA